MNKPSGETIRASRQAQPARNARHPRQPVRKIADSLEFADIYRGYELLQYRSSGCGHYYGRDAGVELREDIDTVLEPGMVVSMEPMIIIPEGMPGAGGYREHDVLVVVEDGAENITAFPYGPEHNIVPGR